MSKVFMVDFSSKNQNNNKINKLKKLFNKTNFENEINTKNLVAVKLHFGEKGKDTFIRPIFVKPIVDLIKKKNAIPFLTDTNTLYSGPRNLGPSHLEVAYEHGFLPQVTGAPIVIADGINGKSYSPVCINLDFFDNCYIANSIINSDQMIVLSHFKGHEMAGFGGAIKNLAMGCAPPIGKGEQHSTKQKINKSKCIGCEKCYHICNHNAIKIENSKASILSKNCIGCGECMTVCPTNAIFLNWKTELTEFNKRMVEYAYAAVKDKPTLYFNFLMDITPNCDCVPWSDEALVPNIGILASTDPVAIDQASLDLVNNKSNLKIDIFKSIHPNTVGEVQLSYGEKINLGTRKYELIKI